MLRPEHFLPGIETNSSILIDRLIPLNIEPAPDNEYPTEMFAVDGYPELFVRRNRYDWDHSVHEAAHCYAKLMEAGVGVLPYAATQIDGDSYVITYKVTGPRLDQAMHPRQTTEFVAGVDQLYEQIGNYMLWAWQAQDDETYNIDVITAEQYMYGTIEKETEPSIRLVDLSTVVISVGDIHGAEDLPDAAILIADEVIAAEALLERPGVLTEARRVVYRLLDAVAQKYPGERTAGWRSLAEVVLTRGTPVTPQDYETYILK